MFQSFVPCTVGEFGMICSQRWHLHLQTLASLLALLLGCVVSECVSVNALQ